MYATTSEVNEGYFMGFIYNYYAMKSVIALITGRFVIFHEIPRKCASFMAADKFFGSAQNSLTRGKLRPLVMTLAHVSNYTKDISDMSGYGTAKFYLYV